MTVAQKTVLVALFIGALIHVWLFICAWAIVRLDIRQLRADRKYDRDYFDRRLDQLETHVDRHLEIQRNHAQRLHEVQRDYTRSTTDALADRVRTHWHTMTERRI